MLKKTPFEQNIIAVIWDFDRTLIPEYMQEPVFEYYNVDGRMFWAEVNGLYEEYEKQGIKVNKDTIYINHFLTCIKQGIFKGLNNKLLRELGEKLEFYNGMPEFLQKIKSRIEDDENFKRFNITLEHYIISTGFVEMIKGSAISKYVDGIWGCEFIERPILSKLEIKEYKAVQEGKPEITQIGYALDNTSKTRAIFEINKGSNFSKDIEVNDTMSLESRRIPFDKMIYIADGPSDVPVFSLLRQNGGKTYAIYPKGNERAFAQVDELLRNKRVDSYGEADYSEGSQTYMWLMHHAAKIAESIYRAKDEQIKSSVSKSPRHLTD
ncbi:MAG TPA: haloacid dehalogenase-like hydrolase [Clostridia bacterium]